ncbi:MAG TPA: VOC family protein [Rhizomicrobium sp.]|jgi:catechol 2,3-dioxygenase-like lactoylglutathione lyase family enzyme|nr:VOC family protein [Rhizomicrobium sp.]
MALEALDHFTIQCADMAATRDFYRDVLGLTDGFRPDLGFPGFWLYAGDRPVVHLLGRANALPENRESKPGRDTNGLDHIAFRGKDAPATIAKLKERGIAFRESLIPDIGLHQVFVRDPNGIMVEMNFRQ